MELNNTRLEAIIQKNLSLMQSNKQGGMQRLIGRESIGGNAGRWNRYHCAGCNFFYEPQTGEITYFDVPQTTPAHLMRGKNEACLRVALMKKSFGKKICFINNGLIVSYHHQEYLPEIISNHVKPRYPTTEQAQYVLNETIQRHNATAKLDAPHLNPFFAFFEKCRFFYCKTLHHYSQVLKYRKIYK